MTAKYNIFSKLSAAIRSRMAYRASYKQLSRLSDHMLNDIGIMRSEIKDVAAGTFNFDAKSNRHLLAEATPRPNAKIISLPATAFLATDISQLKPFNKAA